MLRRLLDSYLGPKRRIEIRTEYVDMMLDGCPGLGFDVQYQSYSECGHFVPPRKLGARSFRCRECIRFSMF